MFIGYDIYPMEYNDEPRATGIGGIFFKAANPQALQAWYADRLGIPFTQWGAAFEWADSLTAKGEGTTAFNIVGPESNQFEGGFSINFRVNDLAGLVAKLEAGGDAVDPAGIQTYSYGKFCHTFDPEGNKVELWEPADE